MDPNTILRRRSSLAFAALYRFQSKLTVLWVVLGCGAIGALLQLAVL